MNVWLPRWIVVLSVLSLSSTGCAWCVDQCLGPPARRPIRAPEKRPPPANPCELLPGSLFRAGDGSSLFFDVDYVEWRHDGISDIFDWRCRGGAIQFREGHMLSDAELENEHRLVWFGKAYELERRP